eukprot:5319543-Pleurochrysis_carterae.AAC.1
MAVAVPQLLYRSFTAEGKPSCIVNDLLPFVAYVQVTLPGLALVRVRCLVHCAGRQGSTAPR